MEDEIEGKDDGAPGTESGDDRQCLTELMTQAFADNPELEGRLTQAEYLNLWVWARMHSRSELLSVMAFGEVLKDSRAPALFCTAMYGMLQQLHHRDDEDEDDEFAPPPSDTNTTNIH